MRCAGWKEWRDVTGGGGLPELAEHVYDVVTVDEAVVVAIEDLEAFAHFAHAGWREFGDGVAGRDWGASGVGGGRVGIGDCCGDAGATGGRSLGGVG